MKKQYERGILVSMACLLIGVGMLQFTMEEPEQRSNQEVNAVEMGENTVLLGGMPVGLYMETDGVLVVKTQSMEDCHGIVKNPGKYLVHQGDYIIGFNGEKIQDKKSLIRAVKHLDTNEVTLTIRRGEEVFDETIHAVENKKEEYKLGLWVRDNVQGLGTITFLKGNNVFGALGHGIHDVDTDVLMEIQDGTIYKTNIHSILKGEDGAPGSMEGFIIYNPYNRLGTITKNKETGIYGTLEHIEDVFCEQIPVEIGKREEVTPGKAEIRCYLNGRIQQFQIEITEISAWEQSENKGILFRVTDEKLLRESGGIVQGFSGSPILQNGKLVGAVTHVLVNDPTSGYGIFIEKMLDEAD